MTADAWVWVSVGLLLALLGARAWVVETGHATLGRTPVKVKVLTGACGLAVALVVGLLAANGGARLVYLVLNPDIARALEDAQNAEGTTTAPVAPLPGTPAPAAPAVPGATAPVSSPPSVPASVAPAPAPGPLSP